VIINKHQTAIFLAGMVVCLLVLEITLRVVGVIYAHRSEADEVIKVPAQCTILCVGDSVTFGLGAPRTESYPAQLQRLLNTVAPQKKFNVINRGRPGQNSAQLLMRLEEYLREIEPDIVTVLIGGANQSNFSGYREYLKKSHKQKNSFLYLINDQLDRIRIYKFFRLLFWNSKNTFQLSASHPPARHRNKPENQGHPYKEQIESTVELSEAKSGANTGCQLGIFYKQKGDYDKALKILLASADKNIADAECYFVIGEIYRERKQYDMALLWHKKGIKRYPLQFCNYEGKGWAYIDQKQYEKAIFWFKKGFEVARPETLNSFCYEGIAHGFRELGKYREAVDFFKKEKKRNPLADDYLHIFKQERPQKEIQNWLYSDVEKIIKLCAKYDAIIILQNYPHKPFVNGVLKKAADRYDIPFVNHHNAFKEIMEDNLLYDQHFVPDGHPNARGYNLMAKNIFMIFKKIF